METERIVRLVVVIGVFLFLGLRLLTRSPDPKLPSAPDPSDPIAQLAEGDCLSAVDILPNDPLLGESIQPTPCSSAGATYRVLGIATALGTCPEGTDLLLDRSQVAASGSLVGGSQRVDTICVEEL